MVCSGPRLHSLIRSTPEVEIEGKLKGEGGILDWIIKLHEQWNERMT